MGHPFLQVSFAHYRIYFWPLLIITIVILFIMNILSQPLVNSQSPLGIISFELAKSPSNSASILNSWDPNDKLVAAFSLGLDFLFMVSYSFTLGLGCVWVAVLLRNKNIAIGAIGIAIAWLQWLAAILDGIENWELMQILLRGAISPRPEIAFWCAAMKFGFILVGISWCLLGTAEIYAHAKKDHR
jgi:hypothetical protein